MAPASWTKANLPPASPRATANGSQVIDVGSATANTPGYAPNRSVNVDRTDNVGATDELLEFLARAAGHGTADQHMMIRHTDPSIPTATALLPSMLTRVGLSEAPSRLLVQELTVGA